MTYILSVSSLMKAGEIRKLCAEMREHPQAMNRMEMQIKRSMKQKNQPVR